MVLLIVRPHGQKSSGKTAIFRPCRRTIIFASRKCRNHVGRAFINYNSDENVWNTSFIKHVCLLHCDITEHNHMFHIHCLVHALLTFPVLQY